MSYNAWDSFPQHRILQIQHVNSAEVEKPCSRVCNFVRTFDCDPDILQFYKLITCDEFLFHLLEKINPKMMGFLFYPII